MGVTSRWINPNAVPLTQDRFNDNGTFSAAKEGKYGYNKVSVGVEPDHIFGKDPDTDEDVEVREEPEPKDPYRPDEGGGGGGGGDEKPPHLVKTVLPSQIAVVKPPDKASYMMGETIEYAGIGVQARLKSGQVWDGLKNGMIPYQELEFPVKKLDDYAVVKREEPEGSPITVKHVGDWEAALKFLIGEAGVNVSPEVHFRTAEVERTYNNCIERGYVANFHIMVRDGILWNVTIDVFNIVEGETFNENVQYRQRLEFIDSRNTGSADAPITFYINYPSSWEKEEIMTEYERHEEYLKYPDGHIVHETFLYMGTANIYFDDPDEIPIYTATSDLNCGIAQPIRYSTRGVAVASEGGSRHRETHFSGGCIALAPRGNAICYITASADGGSMDIDDRWIDEDAGSESEESETVSTGSSFTHNGRTVRFTRGSVAMDGAITRYLPDTASDGAALLQHAGEIAWTMVYGNVTGTDKALPVQWARPGDGKVLETEFNISVATPVE